MFGPFAPSSLSWAGGLHCTALPPAGSHAPSSATAVAPACGCPPLRPAPSVLCLFFFAAYLRLPLRRPTVCTATCPCSAALLDQGELAAHQPDRAAAWLAAAPPLFPRLGLQLAAHLARLMPLLLGWVLAPWPAVRGAALRALLGALQLTWPRAGAHAALTWRTLRWVHEEERLRARWGPSRAPGSAAPLPHHTRYACSLPQQPRRAREDPLAVFRNVSCRVALPGSVPASSAAASSAADLAEDVALALWCAAGPDFQVQLMSSKEGQADQLLQAVMQRLEEAAAAVAELPEGGLAAAAAAGPADMAPRQQQPLAA